MDIIPVGGRPEDQRLWNAYVASRVQSCLYHAYGWRNVISKCYGHNTHYFAAMPHCTGLGSSAETTAPGQSRNAHVSSDASLLGILPLVHLHHWIFGNTLVSMPFFDSGGIAAKNGAVEEKLLEQSVTLATNLGARSIDLRHQRPLGCVDASTQTKTVRFGSRDWYLSIGTQKVSMRLPLPDDPDRLMGSFKAKLRSQIRKPLKEGLTVKVGGIDLLDDFFRVFATNMRDLGSPVHSKRFIEQTLIQFRESSNLLVVYGNRVPMAGALVIGFKDVLVNPWASSLRRYSKLAPNMLLYWKMLELGCEKGFSVFDFGRSSIGESTYKFKEQWGARAEPLFWYRLARNVEGSLAHRTHRDSMSSAIAFWKKLPVPVSILLGPAIRKHISL